MPRRPKKRTAIVSNRDAKEHTGAAVIPIENYVDAPLVAKHLHHKPVATALKNSHVQITEVTSTAKPRHISQRLPGGPIRAEDDDIFLELGLRGPQVDVWGSEIETVVHDSQYVQSEGGGRGIEIESRQSHRDDIRSIVAGE